MTMKRTALLSTCLLLLLLASCKSTPAADPTAPTTTEATAAPTTATTAPVVPTTEATEPPTEAPTFPSAPTVLGNFTQEDADLFTELFLPKQAEDGTWPVNYYNMLLSTEFTAPEKANLRRLFYDQDLDEAGELTEAEKKFLATQSQIALELDVVRVSKKKVEDILQSHLGLTLGEMEGVGLDRMAYFGDTGCYYSSHGDVGGSIFEVLGGTWKEDGTAEVYYSNGIRDMIITLRKEDQRYLVVSNVPMLHTFSREDIEAFTKVFTQTEGTVNYYNRFLGMTVEYPISVDLYQLFCTPVSEDAEPLTDAEKAFLADRKQIDMAKPVMRLTENDMNALLKQYMNQQLHNTDKVGLAKFVYFKDAYYRNPDESGAVSFKITGGTWLHNGNVEVYYALSDGTLKTITLRESNNGSYYVICCQLGASGK